MLVDATSMPAERVGVARYVVDLVGGLGAASGVETHVLCKPRDADDLGKRAQVHTVQLRSRPSRLMWEQTLLPRRVRAIAPDVFHGPHYTLPPGLRRPSVVTFHDPTFFTTPEVHERSKIAYFTRMVRVGTKRATRVVAVSAYAKRGAVEFAGADPDRTDVVYEGVDLDTYAPAESPADERLRSRLGVTRPYLFWVGTIEPRKDVPALVRAYATLVGRGAAHVLVLAGARRWGAHQLDEAVESSGVADRIVRPGYVSDEEKIALYRGADAFVYPSIAEGFGRQVLEAMACGCPVVTTTGSAPEEVAGGAAVLVAPRDDAALLSAIEGVASDTSASDAARRSGLERARAFPIERLARETVEVYRRALG